MRGRSDAARTMLEAELRCNRKVCAQSGAGISQSLACARDVDSTAMATIICSAHIAFYTNILNPQPLCVSAASQTFRGRAVAA